MNLMGCCVYKSNSLFLFWVESVPELLCNKAKKHERGSKIMNTNETKQLVGTEEAAALTGLSQYMLRKGVKEGRFPVIRTSETQGKFLFDTRVLGQVLASEAMSSMNSVKESV